MLFPALNLVHGQDHTFGPLCPVHRSTFLLPSIVISCLVLIFFLSLASFFAYIHNYICIFSHLLDVLCIR